MKTAKLGAIFLISIMALAGVGAGYAAWFDTITIQGTVNTGSVGWDVTGYSCTFVWKIHGLYDETDWGNEIYVDYASETEAESQILVAGLYPSYTIELISYATAAQTMEGDDAVDDSVTVTFDNLFPCIEFKADIEVKYTGTVPGKINDILMEYTNWPTGIHSVDWYTDLVITITPADGTTPYIVPQDQMLGIQLHENDVIHIVMIIHLPQTYDDGSMTGDLMNLLDLSFNLKLIVIQWNEYGHIWS